MAIFCWDFCYPGRSCEACSGCVALWSPPRVSAGMVGGNKTVRLRISFSNDHLDVISVGGKNCTSLWSFKMKLRQWDDFFDVLIRWQSHCKLHRILASMDLYGMLLVCLLIFRYRIVWSDMEVVENSNVQFCINLQFATISGTVSLHLPLLLRKGTSQTNS